MTILITGAHGFLGKHVQKQMSAYGALCPTRQELDLCSSKQVSAWMQKHKPECIIHLAANPNNKPDDDSIIQIINDNILTTQLLCHYAPKGCRFIFASSVVVYGDTPYPADESMVCKPKSIYGATKLSSEAIIQAYTNQQHIRGVSLRLCAMVGIGLTHGMFFDFVRKLRSDSECLDVFGNSPGAAKPFLHVEDAVRIIDFMFNYPYYTTPINVTPEGIVDAKHAALISMEALGIRKNLNWLGAKSIWKGDDNLLQIDSQKLKKIGFSLQYPLSSQAVYKAMSQLGKTIHE